jgi:two-component system sensor kinase FixL
MLIPAPYQDEHDQYLNNYTQSKQARIIGLGREVKALKSNGDIFPVELSVGEVKQSSHPKFTGFIHGISWRVKTHKGLLENRERLHHVSRLSNMGEKAAGIANEINQPLTAMAMHAITLLRKLNGQEPTCLLII